MLSSLTECLTSSCSQMPGFLSFTHPCSLMPPSHLCNRKPAASATATICQSAPAGHELPGFCTLWAIGRKKKKNTQQQQHFRSDQLCQENKEAVMLSTVNGNTHPILAISEKNDPVKCVCQGCTMPLIFIFDPIPSKTKGGVVPSFITLREWNFKNRDSPIIPTQ